MAKIEHYLCPECGLSNPPGKSRCLCGHTLPDSPGSAQSPAGEENKPKWWLAMVPGLIVLVVVTGAAVRNFVEFDKVSRAIMPNRTSVDGKPDGAPRADPGKCVETYAITLHNSEYYVREFSPGYAMPRKNAPRELSTVVQGMARNICSEPLDRVRIRIDVSDDTGKKGSAWAEVGTLAPGQGRPFERAWMGRLTSYRIVEIR